MKILLAGGIIDFYVNKKKYEGYKTERGRWNYVYTELAKILSSLTGDFYEGIEIRNATITSNHFWGQDEFCEVNDLGFSINNQVPLNEDKITLRIFQIDIVGVVPEKKELTDCFIMIEDTDYQIDISNVKIV